VWERELKTMGTQCAGRTEGKKIRENRESGNKLRENRDSGSKDGTVGRLHAGNTVR